MARHDVGRRILALSMAAKVRLLLQVVNDQRLPLVARAALPAVLLYVASPLDLVPDSVPGLRRFDDLLIISAGLALFLWLTPERVIEEHLAELE